MKDATANAEKMGADATTSASSFLSSFKMPDLASSSSAELSAMAVSALDNVKSMLANLGGSGGAAESTVNSITASLKNKDYSASLKSLGSLVDQAKAIPGVSAVLEKVKPMVSGLAIKDTFQGMDTSKILGALQSGDTAGIMGSLQGLMSGGGASLSGEQSNVLQSIMSLFSGGSAPTADGAMKTLDSMLKR
jgi:hypothetical protein